MASCKTLELDGEDMMRCKVSRTRADAARIFRRISASSALAASAISSSPVMQVVIFSSKKRLGERDIKSWCSRPDSPRPAE